MPGARLRVRPAAPPEVFPLEGSTSDPDKPELCVSDEASQLDRHLQKQLEEDVARIFDESIYSDLEVVCGKLKILTHSCILKARTTQFYHKLQSILHANIGKKPFEEIYSFISDAYTECNIKDQEKEIIAYLDDQLDTRKPANNKLTTKAESDEQEVFLTPKCSPYVEKTFQKSISASASTDLTKEYYALVPIESTLERELKEQDALSDAFQSIINSQPKDLKAKLSQSKPTSLSLTSSHITQTVKHSSSCDILSNLPKDSISSELAQKPDVIHPSQNSSSSKRGVVGALNGSAPNNKAELVYSPDSLIADDPSSSSDYLSAAYTFSPGATLVGTTLLNVGDSITKMENTFTSSDSGLENTGFLESLSSHKDITLTDVSLTESTLHDLTADETNDSASTSLDKNHLERFKHGTQSTTSGASSELNGAMSGQSPKLKDVGRKSSKEEKQRQNEEIVILESSSLSSETGSWESVFPPKIAEKEACEKFITSERQYANEGKVTKNGGPNHAETSATSLVQKSPFKSTSCFIDAASLVDEEDESIKVQTEVKDVSALTRNEALPAPSRPVPCSTAKFDVSPNDWSEGNDNDDSLERLDNKDPDPDSIQKDLSPTIFEMTPITEDSLCTNAFESAAQAEESNRKTLHETGEQPSYSTEKESFPSSTVLVSGTPHNSILSLKASSLKQYESEESESDTTIVGSKGVKKTMMKFNEASPIVSGGASIEDHLPHMASHSGSPITRRRIENIPIVSGAYVPKVIEKSYSKSPKPSNASAWVVDMSDITKSDDKSTSSANSFTLKKPGDRTCELLRNGSKSSLDSCHSLENNKSRSSIDSDGSEKSSHKFYIDLSSLPDPIPPKNNENKKTIEKKNIFSMYIDLGEKPTKEMPSRLSSSLNTRKNNTDTKNVSKSYKNAKSLAVETAEVTKPHKISLHNFEKCESLCDDPNINITEIINILDNESSTNTRQHSKGEVVKMEREKSTRHAVENPKPRVSAPVIQEEPVSKQQVDLFVKLSDLDKPAHASNTERCVDVRMTKSIPENNWRERHSGQSSRSVDIISSFHSENTLSLNRLFPHLKDEFSRSAGSLNPGRNRSPLRMTSSAGDPGEDQGSDLSEVSSMHSSLCRSIVDNSTTEDTSQTSSLIGNCQSRLGQDLLRMFLQEIAPDVIVEVGGRRIKAHKCILSSRCQYFAGILSGGWVESAGNVIVLPPFSYNVVHFALCHIYSGVSNIPDTISIVELATIADMLSLEGLKEAIMFTLKIKYCHQFHRPCAVCTAGVLECFPLSSVYGLDDLYRKCLRWISKYFSRVWPTKAFATLPKELLDKCFQHLVINMTVDNIVDTMFGIGITVVSLQNSRWAEVVARMCRRLVQAAADFAAPRLLAVLKFTSDLPPDIPVCAMQAFDDCMIAAIEWAPPEEACRVYGYLSSVLKEMRQQPLYSKPDLIANGSVRTPYYLIHVRAASWRLQCEGALVRSAPRVASTQAFKDLPAELRKRLRELGCILYVGPNPMPMTPPTPERRLRSHRIANACTPDMEQVRALFVPYALRPPPATSTETPKSNNDLRDKKATKSNPPKIRTTKAQEERAKFNLTKNIQKEVKPVKTVPPRTSFENTKPRYLEPKMTKETERKLGPGTRLAAKMISSSESSRNSSPIHPRNARARAGLRGEARAETMSQDSLASRPRTAEPSTESLTESQNSNKYATYTKVKHVKGSVESVNSSRYSNPLPQTSGYKTKTKIPVYLNQSRPNGTVDNQKKIPQKPPATVTRRPDRKLPGSLMMATKSSSAKVVPKVIKEAANKGVAKPKRVNKQPEQPAKQEIPAMERSGTFLKDEPTFGDKTTNIDIDDH